MLHVSKSLGVKAPHLLILDIYRAIHQDFRLYLDEPSEDISLTQFLTTLDTKFDDWVYLTERRRESRPNQNPKQTGVQGSKGYRSGQANWPLLPTSYQFKTPTYDPKSPSYRPPNTVPYQGYTPAPLPLANGSLKAPFPPQSERPSQRQYLPQRQQGYQPGRGEHRGQHQARPDPRGGYTNPPNPNRLPIPIKSENRPGAYHAQDSLENQGIDHDVHEVTEERDEEAEAQLAYEEDAEAYYGASGYRNEDETRDYWAANVNHVASIGPEYANPYSCRLCGEAFPSKNKLHQHLGSRGLNRKANKPACTGRKTIPAVTQQPTAEPTVPNDVSAYPVTPEEENTIVESSVDSGKEIDTGNAFRKYRYARVDFKLTPTGPLTTVCIDTGCGVTLIDEMLVTKALPDARIHTMALPLEVSGIGSDKHRTDRYILAPLYLPGKDTDGKPATAKMATRELHVVTGLRAGMLIGMDIMTPEGIDLINSKQRAWIDSCKLEFPIQTYSKGSSKKRIVSARKSQILPPHTATNVEVHHFGLPDRDYFFEPADTNLTLFAGIVDPNTNCIPVINRTDSYVRIPRNMRLGEVVEVEFDGVYHISSSEEEVAELATRRPKQEHHESWVNRAFKKAVAASAVALLAAGGSTSSAPLALAVPTHLPTNPEAIAVDTSVQDTVLPNGVTVYQGNPQLAKVVGEYPTIWQEGGFADVPLQEWMRIPLRSDWEDKAPKTARVYPRC